MKNLCFIKKDCTEISIIINNDNNTNFGNSQLLISVIDVLFKNIPKIFYDIFFTAIH